MSTDAARAHTRNQRAEKRSLVAWLREQPCADCGHHYPPWVMEFDHEDHALREKVGEIGAMAARRGLLLLLQEICKTAVVCACCHRERSHARGQHNGMRRARPTLKPARRRRTRATH